MEAGKRLQICVEGREFPVRQEDVDRVLMKPLTARIPSKDPLIYGILYDGQALVALMDVSGGKYAKNPDFGKTCILLARGGRRFAVAVEGVRDAPELAEEDGEETDLFRLLLDKGEAPWADSSGLLPEKNSLLPEDNG